MQNYIGKQIDRYRIIERLGMGGMAVVYKAYDVRLEREVALKLIRTEAIPQEQHERLLKRFEREAKAMARFAHPNIVPVFDYGEVDGRPYLVMAYLPGETLKVRIDGPMAVKEALQIVIPIADALAYAHELGIVHRDVKPSNILFTPGGVPVLTDFGIAKILETDEATLTGTGLGVGTPEYMAPEQWQGKASEATDQYALGVVLYELLTGQKPYTAETPVAIALKQMNDPLPGPGAVVNGISKSLEQVLYKALAKDMDDRYADMTAFQKALTAADVEMVERSTAKPEASARPQPAPTPMSEGVTVDELDIQMTSSIEQGEKLPIKKPDENRRKRNWVWLAGGGMVILLVVMGLIGLVAVLFWPKEDKNITEATQATASAPAVPSQGMTSTSTEVFKELTNMTTEEESEITLFSDDFSTESSGWDITSDSIGTTGYVNGKYQILVEAEFYDIWAYPPNDFVDVVVSVSARKVGGPDDNNFGIICRVVDEDHFYMGLIASDGLYIIQKKTTEGYERLSGEYFSESSAINQGAAVNTIRMTCVGNRITLFVNDKRLASVTDSSYTSGGVGLLAGTYDTGGVDIRFDDFIVKEP